VSSCGGLTPLTGVRGLADPPPWRLAFRIFNAGGKGILTNLICINNGGMEERKGT